jgi:hypothetical protein
MDDLFGVADLVRQKVGDDQAGALDHETKSAHGVETLVENVNKV